jgi:hypothetical protein
MAGSVLVAIAASIGNLLQGWDNATIAGNTYDSSFKKKIHSCMDCDSAFVKVL